MNAKPAQKTVAVVTPKTIAQLTAEWATAKAAAELAGREADAKRAEILAHPEGKPGYADDHCKITSVTKTEVVFNVQDKKLLLTLRDEELLKDCSETIVSAEKVQGAAKLNERVKRAVERATTTTTTTSVRFEQVRKKN